jgi:hypothetical protein
MVTKPLSAIDSVNPAIALMQRVMLRPFRFGRWWRMGLLAMACGEMFNSFSCNLNLPSDIGRRQPKEFLPVTHFQSAPAMPDWQILMPIVITLIVGVVALAFVHMYVSSVLRFVMYDAILTEDLRLLHGWSKWHRQGVRLFVFKLVLTFLVLLVLGLVFGVPFIALASRMKNTGPEAAMGLVLSLLIFIPVILVFALISAVFNLFLKDFAVLIMMFEDLGAWDALKRVFGMANRAKGDYAGYIGLKAVMSIAESIAMSIVAFILLLIFAVPLGLTAALSNIKWEELLKDPMAIASLITGLIVAVFIFLFLLSVVGSPATAFFQGYVVNYFGSRYEPLWNVLHPPVAPTPPLDQFPGVPPPPAMPGPGELPSM